jgi:acetylcholinesterase
MSISCSDPFRDLEFVFVFQYTDWEHLGDGYLNQKKIAEVVGDYFFICPTNMFAEQFAQTGSRVYYYYFTQVPTDRPPPTTLRFSPTVFQTATLHLVRDFRFSR